MASRSLLNCTATDHITASADIVGYGVVRAFFCTALLTLLTIAYGYLSKSVPNWYLTQTDYAIISLVNIDRIVNQLFTFSYNSKAAICWILRMKVSPRRPDLSRTQREQVFTRFILALSDQQLVTGLAILIGTVANQHTLTTYDFNMAFTLAWFSAITHLATLDVLQDYLISHKTMRNWRIFGMLSFLVLLLYFLGVATNKPDDSVPVQCLFEHPEMGSLGSLSGGMNSFEILSLMSLLTTGIWVLKSYLTRICWSLRKRNKILSAGYYLAFYVWKFCSLRAAKFIDWSQVSSSYRSSFLEHIASLDVVVLRREHLVRIQDPNSGRWRRCLHIFAHAWDLYRQSFLSAAPEIMFMVSYGFTQSIAAHQIDRTIYAMSKPDQSRKVSHQAIVEVDTSMGFGQIFPIFLLILPLFAAAEIYYDARHDDHEESFFADRRISGKHSALLRADTAFSVSSMQDHGLEGVALDDDGNASLVQRYFYLEWMEVMTKSATTHTVEHTRRIRRYYALAQDFSDIERRLRHQNIYVLFMLLFECGISLLAGILLNISRVPSLVVGVFLVLMQLLKVLLDCVRTFRCAFSSLSNDKTLIQIMKHISEDAFPTNTAVVVPS
ncbi:hypothetical protein DM02DRAFT_662676 [Periconia macrospinosa]|uniref:Uncharacterized protein n=1 Tax=Periconia macrospinosa TaxID=97972 RepID=A0A2V1D3U6_9PLEO|nr:hypothetical protein DM02DRAFT_662676 [Periconia macrospinosa]